MKNIPAKKSSAKQLVLNIATGLAFLGIGMSVANADSFRNKGYLTDTSGSVVKNAYNGCWRTGYWTQAMANAECDPDLVQKEEPKIVQPEPVRPPAPASVVIAPVLKMSTFNADAFFDYDKATLKPEGKTKLDKLVEELKGAKFDIITVIGHADRFGSEAYNMKLSTRRAEAAKAYLVSVKEIEASKVTAIGKGEPSPMTKPGECEGNTRTKKMIACLQPDRRVDIEVSVMKEVLARK